MEQGLDGGGRILARGVGRLVCVRNMRLAHSHAFIGAEKKKLVFFNWSPTPAAEIVLPQLGSRQSVSVGEPIVGIQLVVAEVLECRAVKRVRAGFCHYRDLSAGGTSIFRRKGRSKNPELFECVQRHQVAGASKGAGCRKLAG